MASRDASLISTHLIASAQHMELCMVYIVLQHYPLLLNLYSDSQYLVPSMKHLETVWLTPLGSFLYDLLQLIQQELHAREKSSLFWPY